MNNKVILFITSRLPFPATSGRKNSLYNYCKIIKKLGNRLIVASFDDGSNANDKPEFIDKLIILPKISTKTKIYNLLKYSFFTNKFPMQVSLYYDKKIKEKIKEIIQLENVEIVIADMVRTTEYIKDLDNVYKIADLDDRLSLRYKRQLECNINDVNPYGLFLNSVPKFIQKIMLINWLKKNVMISEIKLLDKYELNIAEETDLTIFVAKSESENFNNELNCNKSIAVPIGVDVKYFKYTESTGNNENLIGFLGVLNVAHNEHAVKHFVKNIFPLIQQKKPNSKFVIIGGGASEELKKLASEKIIFTGRVEDVREYLCRCKVFVCPLTFGSGIKTKNLEAMSLGIPVVTTTIGAENINAENGEDWFVTDDYSKMADIIVNLINDDELRKKIGKNGSEYINKNFTWDVAEEELKKILD